MRNKHIFLSYRSAEAEFALRLAADLKNAGVNLWMDRLDIKPGDDWIYALQNGVNDCAAIISVLSPGYVSSKYCRRELARADRMGRPIFPVILRPVPAEDWPFEIERRQYIDFSDWQDERIYHEKLAELVKTLKEHVAGQIQPIPDVETRYLNSLIAELEARKGVLEYVELSAMTQASSVQDAVRPKPRVEEAWGMDGAFTLIDVEDTSEDSHIHPPRRRPIEGISQALEKYSCFVLIGAPGAGKTTTIQRLALDAARMRQQNPSANPLPLLVTLPAWSESSDLQEFIRAQWPFDSDPFALMTQGKLLLYMDGLNEMGALGPRRAGMLREWLHGPNAPKQAVITCRSGDYAGELVLDLPTVVAEEMDEPRIRRFVTNYLGKDAAAALLVRLIPNRDSDLDTTRHLFVLARNPFLLSVLILVYMSSPDHDLPRNMGALFKRLVAELWERERLRKTPGWMPFEQMERAFSHLACSMIDEDMPNYVPKEFVIDFLESESLLRAGISANLLASQGETVHFYHQLIQEYLAAVGLAGLGLPTKLLRPKFDRRGARIARKWDQVIIALSGIVAEPDWVVLDVMEVDPYLALECIASGIPVTSVTKQQVISQLKRFVESDETDGRIAAAKLLNSVRDPAAVDFLLDVMRDAPWEMRQAAMRVLKTLHVPALPGLLEALLDWDQELREATATAVRQIGVNAIPVLIHVLHDERWSVRRGAAWALGEIGDRSAVPALLEALKDEDGLVRREAAVALAWLRDKDAVPGLLEALRDKDWRVRKAAAETLGWIGQPAVEGLLEVLNDSSINVRRVVVEALGRIRHAAAVPRLVAALRDDSPEVRAAAVESLGWIRDAQAVAGLIEALEDTARLKQDERRVCDLAASALEQIATIEALVAVNEWRKDQGKGEAQDTPETVDNIELTRLIHVLLNDEDGLKRWSSAKALSSFKDSKAVSALLNALGDEDVLVRDTASESLAQIGEPAVPGLLIAVESSNVEIRGAAIEALGKIRDLRAVPLLAACLNDTAKPWLDDARICDLAVKALEKIASSEALEAARAWRRENTPLSVAGVPESTGSFYGRPLSELLKALNHAEWNVREDAAKALKEQAKLLKGTKHSQVLQTLIPALSDKSWFVRWAVCEGLAWIGDTAAVPQILILLKDSNWMVRVAALRALIELGDSQAVPNLIEALQDDYQVVREVAAEALGLMGNISAVPQLLNTLYDQEVFVRRAAVEALGAIGDSRVTSEVTAMLHDVDQQVRWAAAEALGKIGDPAAVSELILCLEDTYAPEWEDRRICDVAAESLEKIGTPEARKAVELWRLRIKEL